MISFTEPQPLAEAIRSISGRTPIGSALRTKAWRDVPLALREAALFSAGVESARLLQSMKGRLTTAIAVARRQEGAFQRRDTFVAEMRRIAREEGLGPTDPKLAGGLRDITSIRRLRLIWDTQIRRAEGYARWTVQNGNPDVVDQWPAQELLRVAARRAPRDWLLRWRVAGGPGNLDWPRMIARKDDPVWVGISAFACPWPPFDYNSGMGLRSLDRDEAEAVGVLSPGESVAPNAKDFREGMRASARGLDPAVLQWLRDAFGNQIRMSGDEVSWAGTRADVAASAPASALPPDLEQPPQPTGTEDGPGLRTLFSDIDARIARLEQIQLDLVRQRSIVGPAVAPEQRRVDAALAAHRQARARGAWLPPAARGSLALDDSAVRAKHLGAGEPQVCRQAAAGREAVERLVDPSLFPPKVTLDEIQANDRESGGWGTIHISETSPPEIVAHEIIHNIEHHNPHLLQESVAFRASRTAPGEQPVQLMQLYPAKPGERGYDPWEVAYEDKWGKDGRGNDVPHPAYAGKEYQGNHSTEVLSMAIQRLVANPAAFARNDPEYFDWAINVLRAQRPGPSVTP